MITGHIFTMGRQAGRRSTKDESVVRLVLHCIVLWFIVLMYVTADTQVPIQMDPGTILYLFGSLTCMIYRFKSLTEITLVMFLYYSTPSKKSTSTILYRGIKTIKLHALESTYSTYSKEYANWNRNDRYTAC